MQENWANVVSSITNAFQDFGSVIGDLVDEIFNRQLETVQNNLDAQLEYIDENTQETLQRYGLQDMSKSQQLQNEMTNIRKILT